MSRFAFALAMIGLFALPYILTAASHLQTVAQALAN